MQAEQLIAGIAAEYLPADQGYYANQLLAAARAGGMTPVIPPKRSRKVARQYDRALHRLRHW